MSLDIKHWNGRFIDHYRKNGVAFNQAADFGITIERAKGLRPGDKYWACIGVYHLSGRENQGNHNVYCDVLDGANDRVNRAMLQLKQGHMKPVTAIVDKPHYEAGTNFPIWGETPSDVKVIETRGYKSDLVRGFRINHPDELGGGNTIGHHSFYAVWKEVVFTNVSGPYPEPEPPMPRPEPPDGSNGETIVKTESMTIQVGNHQVDILIVIRDI